MIFLKKTISICFLLVGIQYFTAQTPGFRLSHLLTEYTETPLGIDVERPRFSWQMDSGERGALQIAYRIVVASEKQEIVWDSGKIIGNVSLNIEYLGMPLQPRTRYKWEITVWNRNKHTAQAESWFETGLMDSNPKLSAWHGAKWIGGDDQDLPLYSHYLPVFKISYSLQLGPQSTKASFIYGANDMRLEDKNRNLFQLKNNKNGSYIAIELDVSALHSGGNAKLNIFRVGYSPDDKTEIPFKSFIVGHSLINNVNGYDYHAISLSSNLGYTRLYIDGEQERNLIGEVNLNPLGQGGDFTAFPVVGDFGFSVEKSQQAHFKNLEIRNFRSPSNILFAELFNKTSTPSIFIPSNAIKIVNGEYILSSKDSSIFVTADPSRNAMPMLRSLFTPKEKKISKVRLYVTARGIYDVYLNGSRVNEDYFNPGLTQYPKTQFYQTFDLTEKIVHGVNAFGAVLGEGWWSGGATYMGEFWNFFGDRQSLVAQLVVTYEDGQEDFFVTNPLSWAYNNNGPVVYSSFFQGEVYDARKLAAFSHWSTANYNPIGWKAATEVTLQGHISLDNRNLSANMPMVDDYSRLKLIGQFGPTVKAVKELTAVGVEQVRPGVFIYDMGQNMAAVPEIKLKNMQPGQQIVLRYAEVKYPNIPEYSDLAGTLMLENIRAAMAQDIYIANGGDEMISPRFTFHGYRYIEITGINEALPLEAVKSFAVSSIHKLSSGYKTSNPKVNKLWENITWSAYSNFISIPTDCPQRNERLGWSGDISVFSQSASYLTNAAQFLRRHMLAMRDTQREDGRFADIAPLGGGFGGVLWGSAGINVAWQSYLQYQDKALLDEHYDAMKAYIVYLNGKVFNKNTGILQEEHPDAWGNLADWLSPEESKNDKTLLWDAQYIYDLEIMGKIATILNKTEDKIWFMDLYTKRKQFFNTTYFDPDSGKTIHHDSKQFVDTQASYALPIAFGLVDEKFYDKAAERFNTTVARENITDSNTSCPSYSLMTGFIATAAISKALSESGHVSTAYKLLQQTQYPSWLYSVEQGATTIWERLNSYTHKFGFGGNNRMNSFNHYSFGAICAWMYNYSLGIERDENHPGFKHFILKPEPDFSGEMTFAQGYYDSLYGRIESSWEFKGGRQYYCFVIPANTSATVYLNTDSVKNIFEKSRRLIKSPGVKYLGRNNNKVVLELPAGTYNIEINEP